MYTNDSMGWADLIENKRWPHSHTIELCRKLSQSDQSAADVVVTVADADADANAADVIDYEYLKTTCKLNDDEIYEIGATALDSSIMLTFQNIGKPSNDNSG